VVTLALLAPAGARASFPGDDGAIAYTFEGRIWALDPGTKAQFELTSGPGDADPSFSASGDWLAFQRTAAAKSTIFLERADGSGLVPLTTGREPAFSPDGRRIVFTRADGLFVTSAIPGSPVHRLTDRRGDIGPRWSSTGTIVFERDRVRRLRGAHGFERQVTDELATIAPPSRRVQTLLTYELPGVEEEIEMRPDWSPASTKVAAALCNYGPSAPIRTVPALILHGECSPYVWAPDGHGLAEPKVGALSGRPGTNCPHFISAETEVSWQPLHPGTLRVPTVDCQPVPPEPEGAVEPARSVRGARTCYYDRHTHRRRCFTS
jgi:hypothetical protein